MLKNIIQRSFSARVIVNNFTIYDKNASFRIRQLHKCVCLNKPRHGSSPDSPSPAIASKYRVISEENAQVIENTADEILHDNLQIDNDEFEGLNLKRGINGVFDIEDVMEILKRDNSKNIFVVSVPKEINYVDYIVIVSGRSSRHILALAEFVRKVYKHKCQKNDYIPRIEGKRSNEWMALDLGNIALHIFTEKARSVYDLETLWAVGREYDEQINKKSDVVDIFENYSAYLKDFKPLA